MRARDIDLIYGEDGRALQAAHLVEGASVQLPGTAGAGGRQVSARTIDIGMAPDGGTVTSLAATQNVQVDLPASADTPARRIRSAVLTASGEPGQGLQRATFTGGVDFRETRAANARRKVAAVNRTARSERLDVTTKPGFGDVEKAEFHGTVHFTDGSDTTADAPVALYDVAGDALELHPPAAGERGAGPHVSNDRLQVDARVIRLALTSESMKADTNVRSVIQPQRGKSQDATKVPGMLKQGEPVNVKANRLDYDGDASLATYTGDARLWQEDTVVQGDRIVIDDKNGNLHATSKVRTVMTLKQAGAPDQGGRGSAPEPTTTVADDFLYENSAHRATYTTKAHMSGPQGDVTADRIELYLTEDGGELERAEGYGEVVTRQDTRRGYGSRMTYLARTDAYTLTGAPGVPVKVYDDTPPNCKVTTAAALTFHRGTDTIRSIGNETTGQKTESIACGTVKR
jgi:lipopolysaccharide export system protein LptA